MKPLKRFVLVSSILFSGIASARAEQFTLICGKDEHRIEVDTRKSTVSRTPATITDTEMRWDYPPSQCVPGQCCTGAMKQRIDRVTGTWYFDTSMDCPGIGPRPIRGSSGK